MDPIAWLLMTEEQVAVRARALSAEELESELGKVVMARVRAHQRRERWRRWLRYFREVFWG